MRHLAVKHRTLTYLVKVYIYITTVFAVLTIVFFNSSSRMLVLTDMTTRLGGQIHAPLQANHPSSELGLS